MDIYGYFSIHLSLHLCICLSIDGSVYLSILLFKYLSVDLSSLFISFYPRGKPQKVFARFHTYHPCSVAANARNDRTHVHTFSCTPAHEHNEYKRRTERISFSSHLFFFPLVN